MKRVGALYGVLFLTAGNFILQLLGLLYRMMLSRLAGAEVMGLLSLLMPVYALFAAGVLPGLTAAVSALAARAWALKKPSELKSAVAAAEGLFLVAYGMVFVSVLLLGEQIAERLLGDASLKNALFLLLVCFLFSGAESTKKAALMAAGKIEMPFFSELAEQGVRFASVCFFLRQTMGGTEAVEAVVRGMAVSELFGGAVLHVLYRIAFKVPRQSVKKPLYRALLFTAVPINLSALASSVLKTIMTAWLPTGLLLFGMTRREALAELGAACSMAASVTALPAVPIGAIGSILMQRLQTAVAKNRHRDIQKKLHQAIGATLGIGILSLAFYLLFGKAVCLLLYQNERAALYVPYFAFYAVLSYASSVLHSAQNGLGMQVSSAAANFTAVLVVLAADLWLVPRFGMRGHVFGMMLGEGYCLTESILCIKKKCR